MEMVMLMMMHFQCLEDDEGEAVELPPAHGSQRNHTTLPTQHEHISEPCDMVA